MDGDYKGDLKFTDVDEDSVRWATDYTLYFEKLESKNNAQTVTVLLFFEKEPRTKPVKDTYTIDKDEAIYELDIKVTKINDFDSKLEVAEIEINEEGKNTIYPSSKSNMEYIKLEAPEGFTWELSGEISGDGALSNAIDYDIKYDTLKGEKQENTLLIGIIGVDKDRSRTGSLYLNKFILNATDKADKGDVKVRISGAGIPYERVIMGTYVDKKDNNNNNNGNNNGQTNEQKFIVNVIENVSQLFVNGSAVPMDTRPFIRDSRLMLPVSHVAVAFGIPSTSIHWDPINRTVRVIDGDRDINLTIDSQIMIINGSPYVMDTTATIVDNRTFIPMRFLADALGFETSWNDTTRTATLFKTVSVESY